MRNTYAQVSQHVHIAIEYNNTHYAHMKKEDEKLTERVHFLATPSMVKAMDDYGFDNRIRTKGEAIRKLIEIGLKNNE
ncbi:MAG: hypothetical protein COA45_01345 [Zetaproteobacteria bacterium]|nr:MAG: hypothetical protein COA45_01345 [Zetaproteobacteria bacterium]